MTTTKPLARSTPGNVIQTLSTRGTLTARGWVPPADLGALEWRAIGPQIAAGASMFQFVVGDWIIAGERFDGFAGVRRDTGELVTESWLNDNQFAFVDADMVFRGKVDGKKVDVDVFDFSQSLEDAGFAKQTQYNWVWTCKKFPNDPDHPLYRWQDAWSKTGHLKWSHYRACTSNKLPADRIVALLSAAETGRWSVETLERHVQAYLREIENTIEANVEPEPEAPEKKYLMLDDALRTYVDPAADAILHGANVDPVDARAAAEAAIRWLYEAAPDQLLKGALHNATSKDAVLDLDEFAFVGTTDTDEDTDDVPF